jgi:RNA polymerase sigma-70 factor (ECF subfamily)
MPDPDELGGLLDRIRGGDEDALYQLLQQYEARLRTAARVLLGPDLRSQMDSLDLVQSVHRVLLPGLREGKYEIASVDKLIALARTVVRHKVIRNWRRLQRERGVAGRDEGDAEADPAQAAQTNDTVRHLLQSLPEGDRRIIELRLEGFSTAEIARQLELDAHALRAKLSRLRQKLRAAGFGDWI